MILRPPTPRSLPSALNYLLKSPCYRCLHARTSSSPPTIPQPTPFVPDPSTFLTLIGRNLSQHSAKIPTWISLFSLTSKQLRDLGVEPARTRRYLLWWRDRFRKGVFGVGGDLKNVKDGGAELRIVEVSVPKATIPNESSTNTETGLTRVKKMIVNQPAETVAKGVETGQLKPVEGMKVVGARTIVGPYVQPVKGTSGSVATIRVQEGMWEVRRGTKVDGGERRKVQVRRKRLLAERKTSRK
ncbi:hypothetical protein OEA41_004361 [Lepraria neglecta]|uniref:Small ribosomal subunit protein mS41 n=1 Tax=Lepraria neglecta TaxID=209136 RepID=A0AAD9YXP9_9LECA|nr:hypothetical protein OEA41_004361 [Lepraria neglecta]